MTTRSLMGAALAAVMLLGSSKAHAVLPPAKELLAGFASKQALDTTKPVPLTGTAVVQTRPDAAPVTARFTLESTGPGNCTARVDLPDGTSQAALSGGQVTTSGPSLPALEALVALGCPLSSLKGVPAARAETQLAQTAKAWGVNTSVVSLSLMGRRPSWVIGAKSRDLTRPQIWLDKERSRPVRIIATRDGTLWDVRYGDPASIATDRNHARVTEVWRDGRRQLAVRLMTAATLAPQPSESDVTDELAPTTTED